MKKTDKTLIGIVVGIVLLVVMAFGVALSKPKPTYQAEDTPEGVAFNYLFALQQMDYERAYGYLSPSIKGYPRDVDAFTDDVQDRSWTFDRLRDSSTTVEVETVKLNEKRATVTMLETRFYEGDLFDSGTYSYGFDVTLRQDGNGAWRIVEADQYWLVCWDDPSEYGCK